MQNPFLSFIIPAYNEEQRIALSLEKAIDYLSSQNYGWEFLIVDDGSKDRTCGIVAAFIEESLFSENIRLVKLGKNLGKGAAVRRGMLEARGEIRVFSDADLSTPIKELEKVIPIIKSGVDVCIGSRDLNRNLIKKHQPFYREYMGRIFNKIVQMLVIKGITDTQCGFKAFRGSSADKIFAEAKIDGFSFDVEAIYIAKMLGMKVEQVPVEWYNDTRSKVSPITDSARMFFELFKIRRLHK